MNKFILYRLLFPFRSRLQKRLREQRAYMTWEMFSRGIEPGPRHEEVTRLLWNHLREKQAFVEDFRPDPQDEFSEVYAMGPEEVLDELIEPISDKLGIDLNFYENNDISLVYLNTPSDAARFLMNLITVTELR